MRELVPLIAFSIVSSVTPGPNNLLLWASGLQFGYRATLPHVVGTSVGLGSMAMAVAAGTGALVTAFPVLQLALKAIGSLYLLYLAYQIAASGAMRRADVAHPLRFVQAVTFQYINPKAWIFALAAITTFRPPGLPIVLGSLLVAATMMLVIVPTASLWAAGGSAIGRFVTGRRAHRAVSVILALLLVASIAGIWV
jgi:threonine/homoserine/homoserine lactone efflux protein